MLTQKRPCVLKSAVLWWRMLQWYTTETKYNTLHSVAAEKMFVFCCSKNWYITKYIFTVYSLFPPYVSVNSKRDHPPPPPGATPGHLTPVQLHTVRHLTRIEARPIGHLTRRKNAGHRSRVKRILYSMSQVITPRGFRWFVISSVLLYSEICHYRKFGIFRRTWGKRF